MSRLMVCCVLPAVLSMEMSFQSEPSTSKERRVMKIIASTFRWPALALFVLIVGAAQAQQTAKRYDLLIKNGHVIDPKNSINERRDVAIAAGKITAVEKSID